MKVAWLWTVLVLACGCGSLAPTSPADRKLYEDFERERAGVAKAEVMQAERSAVTAQMLKVITTDQTTDGRVMKLRGKLYNPLPETVTGAWLIVRLMSHTGSNATERETAQKEISATIPPGETTALRWDIQSSYLGSSPGGFLVEAYPKRIGDREMDPPPDWK